MHLLLVSLVVVAYAKPPKSEPAPVATPVPVVEAVPPPAPAPELAPEPTRLKNADLSVVIARADGTSSTLKVTGIERSIDFYADQGWTSDDGDLRISVEVGTTEKSVAWKDVKSVTVTPGKMPDDLDCTYSSDFTPWMYECTIKTVASVVMKDGTKGTVNNRHKWRFTQAEGAATEFWLFKHTARMQDEGADGSMDAEENTKIYPRLQEQLRAELKTTLVKSVTVQ